MRPRAILSRSRVSASSSKRQEAAPSRACGIGRAFSAKLRFEILRRAILQQQKGHIAALGALPQRHDRRIGDDAVEDAQIAEIHDAFDRRILGEEAAQALAGAGAKKARRGDEAQPSAVFQQSHAFLEEIGVEIGALGGDGVMSREIGLRRFEIFHPHIGRIAEDDIEAAARRNIVDEAVAGAQIVVRAGWIESEPEGSRSSRRLGPRAFRLARRGDLRASAPQRAARGFHRARIYVHAEEIIGDRLARRIERDRRAERNLLIASRDFVEGRVEKRAIAAGGIDDLERPKCVEPCAPEGGRLASAMLREERRAPLVERQRNGARDEKTGDGSGRVDDAAALALGSARGVGGAFIQGGRLRLDTNNSRRLETKWPARGRPFDINCPGSSAASGFGSGASASSAPWPRSGECARASPRTAGRLPRAYGRCSCRCRSACAARAPHAG